MVEVLRGDWITTGPKVGEFEAAMCAATGAEHALAVSSGTSALHAALAVAGVGPGDEVITSPLTFAASANAALYVGATPVFADVDPETLNLDPEAVAERITPRTKAIVAVDYAGQPATPGAFRDLADDHDLVYVEDAAHSLGGEWQGRRVGSWADFTCFSFHPVKHITTAEGGMVTTNDDAHAKALRLFRSHGIDSDPKVRHEKGLWHYDMVRLGYNYRIPDTSCALGIAQLSRLDENLRRRKEVAARYQERLAEIPGIRLPKTGEDVEHAWHLFPVRIQKDRFGVDRGEAFQALRAENIGVNVHYIPVHYHPYYRERFGFEQGLTPHAEAAYEELLSLPMFHAMTDADVDDVVRALEKIHANRAG